jgi:hypothetical protein
MSCGSSSRRWGGGCSTGWRRQAGRIPLRASARSMQQQCARAAGRNRAGCADRNGSRDGDHPQRAPRRIAVVGRRRPSPKRGATRTPLRLRRMDARPARQRRHGMGFVAIRDSRRRALAAPRLPARFRLSDGQLADSIVFRGRRAWPGDGGSECRRARHRDRDARHVEHDRRRIAGHNRGARDPVR